MKAIASNKLATETQSTQRTQKIQSMFSLSPLRLRGKSFFMAASILIATTAHADITIKAANKLPFARPSQTIELKGIDIAALNVKDLHMVHVKDQSGKELLTQAVDTDFDELHKPDIVIFQSDFAPNESKTFTVSAGEKIEYKPEDFKAYGRFNRERFDDYVWENDRIAHRTYGKALITWKGEPLTSSSIDIWSKRTPKMVVDQWYMVDNYHHDNGEGYDDYSAGATRGDGGDGLWAADKLWVASNFVDSHTLAAGPIRVMFELMYDAFDVNGTPVTEIRRISLDAGQNLDHYEIKYQPKAPGQPLTAAIGLRKMPGDKKDFNAEHGWLSKWEKMEKNGGMQGVAVVIDPKLIEKQTEDKQNDLILTKVSPDTNSVSYWAGFCWDKFGPFKDDATWKTYVDQSAQGAASPIEVNVAP